LVSSRRLALGSLTRPRLPIEFARTSDGEEGCLTLVLKPGTAGVPTLWSFLGYPTGESARATLRQREGWGADSGMSAFDLVSLVIGPSRRVSTMSFGRRSSPSSAIKTAAAAISTGGNRVPEFSRPNGAAGCRRLCPPSASAGSNSVSNCVRSALRVDSTRAFQHEPTTPLRLTATCLSIRIGLSAVHSTRHGRTHERHARRRELCARNDGLIDVCLIEARDESPQFDSGRIAFTPPSVAYPLADRPLDQERNEQSRREVRVITGVGTSASRRGICNDVRPCRVARSHSE
jgi:hypothetical protein